MDYGKVKSGKFIGWLTVLIRSSVSSLKFLVINFLVKTVTSLALLGNIIVKKKNLRRFKGIIVLHLKLYSVVQGLQSTSTVSIHRSIDVRTDGNES